jgi:hypothetical protein
LRIAKEINEKATPYVRPESDLKISYLIFTGSADKPFGPPDYARWHQRCSELLAEMGGVGEGYGLHHWEDRLQAPAVPAAEGPASAVPASAVPAAAEPTSAVPASGVPTSAVPTTAEPASGVPAATGPAATESAAAESASVESAAAAAAETAVIPPVVAPVLEVR